MSSFSPKGFNFCHIISRKSNTYLDFVNKKPYDSIHEIKEELKENLLSFNGRVLVVRQAKSVIFAEMEIETTKKIQILINKEENSTKIKAGYIIYIEGWKVLTNVGTESLKAKELKILSSTNQHLPKENNSNQRIKNHEVKYEKRFLDLMINLESKNKIIKRFEIINFLRQFLIKNDFIEVETPILSNNKSGALAKPFKTYHETLGKDLFMRVAPEIHLKLLIISGFNKIFEIGKNFRNEDISTRHNPEFTSCEFYAAYWNYKDLISFTKKFISEVFEKFYFFDQAIENNFSKIDYTDFTEIDVIHELEKLLNLSLKNFTDENLLIQKCLEVIDGKEYKVLLKKNKIKYNKDEEIIEYNEREKQIIIDIIIENEIEEIIERKNLNNPVFIFHHPKLISPLAKTMNDYPLFTERFEFYIRKMEIINAYSELNDFEDQAKRLEIDLNTPNKAEKNTADFEFVNAMSYGMPPTGGWGLGVDRLVMLLLQESNIKEIITFPMMGRRH